MRGSARRKAGCTARGRVPRTLHDERGQATVEFALVMIAILPIMLALALLWRAAQQGRLVQLAHDNASHSVEAGRGMDGVQDISLY